LKVGYLLAGRSKLGHLLTSGVKLLHQPPAHLRLFGKAVPGVFLLAEKLGLLVTTRHEGLQATQVRSTKKGETKDGSMDKSYLANQVDDVA
jgi:hypothetical protein